ncbi:EXOC6 protein, partial [Panurus biarmicus]|nr:EXOC6 protein [Panurus biarmicus]
RSVYDDQPNAHQKFMEKLDACIRNHDREIEKMCNFHHQGFVDAITELLKVRADAEKLKVQVTDTNRRLQDAGKEVIAQTEEIIRCRVQQRNITTVVEKLQLCLPVLEMYSKLKEQMSVKSKSDASLTVIHSLRDTYACSLSGTSSAKIQKLWWCLLLEVSLMGISHVVSLIRTGVLELQGKLYFLMSSCKDHLGEIKLLMAQQQKTFSSALQKQNNVNYGRNMHLGRNRILESKNEITLKRTFEDEDEHEEEVLTAQDLVDFSPVYRCLHIYSVLGDGEIFENYYRKQRRKQARLVLQPQSNMHETVEGYRRYFSQIVGFFVVEDHILHVTQGLVTRTYTDELWNMALSKIIAVLRTHSVSEKSYQYCSLNPLTSELYVFKAGIATKGRPKCDEKIYIYLHILTPENTVSYMSTFFSLHLFIRDIFEADNYSPIPVANEEEYRIVISKFPFQDPELDK